MRRPGKALCYLQGEKVRLGFYLPPHAKMPENSGWIKVLTSKRKPLNLLNTLMTFGQGRFL